MNFEWLVLSCGGASRRYFNRRKKEKVNLTASAGLGIIQPLTANLTNNEMIVLQDIKMVGKLNLEQLKCLK